METLNPRVRAVWALGALFVALLAGAASGAVAVFLLDLPPTLGAGVAVVAGVLGLVHVVYRYRVWRFEVQEDALYLERGVLTRVNTVVPYVRVQHVDTQRGPVERVAGLASVVVYTAGSRGADVSIPGLTPERADDLQEELRALARESEHEDAV